MIWKQDEEITLLRYLINECAETEEERIEQTGPVCGLAPTLDRVIVVSLTGMSAAVLSYSVDILQSEKE